MAIDREAITEAIFTGTRTPADVRRSPRSSRATARTPASTARSTSSGPTSCSTRPASTRSQPVELWFNAGAGHDAVDARPSATSSARTSVSSTCCAATCDFAEYLPLQDEKGMTGPFRLGWIMDYPSPQNYLEPLYSHRGAAAGGLEHDVLLATPSSTRLSTRATRPAATRRPSRCTSRPRTSCSRTCRSSPMFFGSSRRCTREHVEQRDDRRLRSTSTRRGTVTADTRTTRTTPPGVLSDRQAPRRLAARTSRMMDDVPRPETRAPCVLTEEGHGPLRRAPTAAHHPGPARRLVPDLRDGLRPARATPSAPSPATGRSRPRSWRSCATSTTSTTRCSSSTSSTSADLLQGDFGTDFRGRPVLDTIAQRLPVTVQLTAVAVALRDPHRHHGRRARRHPPQRLLRQPGAGLDHTASCRSRSWSSASCRSTSSA